MASCMKGPSKPLEPPGLPYVYETQLAELNEVGDIETMNPWMLRSCHDFEVA